jgi:hypothetical protein
MCPARPAFQPKRLCEHRLCYDLDFPHAQAGKANADLLLVPARDWCEIGHIPNRPYPSCPCDLALRLARGCCVPHDGVTGPQFTLTDASWVSWIITPLTISVWPRSFPFVVPVPSIPERVTYWDGAALPDSSRLWCSSH